MTSYPDYDVNLFATGITNESWQKLQPKNERNPLEPKPLYNMATMTSATRFYFKMVTAFGALERGLDPYAKYADVGYIQSSDGKRFGCWIWNQYRGQHGLVDLKKAIEVSCNYYFYDIALGMIMLKKKKK